MLMLMSASSGGPAAQTPRHVTSRNASRSAFKGPEESPWITGYFAECGGLMFSRLQAVCWSCLLVSLVLYNCLFWKILPGLGKNCWQDGEYTVYQGKLPQGTYIFDWGTSWEIWEKELGNWVLSKELWYSWNGVLNSPVYGGRQGQLPRQSCDAYFCTSPNHTLGHVHRAQLCRPHQRAVQRNP